MASETWPRMLKREYDKPVFFGTRLQPGSQTEKLLVFMGSKPTQRFRDIQKFDDHAFGRGRGAMLALQRKGWVTKLDIGLYALSETGQLELKRLLAERERGR